MRKTQTILVELKNMIIRWLSNKPKKDKQQEIWRGIVRKAKADNDHSLNDVVLHNITPLYRKTWVGAVAVALLALAASVWMYQATLQRNILKEAELKEVFADENSVSKLVLSNGDTILLDGHTAASSNMGYLITDNQSLDFRKFNDEELLGQIQTLETGRGKQLTVTLSDGTQVWLNASSKIEFPARFAAGERKVTVDGEAYFEVAHNKESPFLVIMDGQQVKVLGTHFNVRHYKEEVAKSITLLEGAVEVRGIVQNTNPVLLKPSEQLVQLDGTAEPIVRTLVDASSVIAWKDGDFYFEEASADVIVREIERWYPISIKITKQDSTKKISGRIRRADSLKEVADMLRFFDIEIQIERNE